MTLGLAKISELQHEKHNLQKKKKNRIDFTKIKNFCSSETLLSE